MIQDQNDQSNAGLSSKNETLNAGEIEKSMGYDNDDDDEFLTAVDGLLQHFKDTTDKETITNHFPQENPELLENIAGYIAYRVCVFHYSLQLYYLDHILYVMFPK